MPPISWQPKFETSPPKPKYCVLSYPAPSVLLVRLDRPKALNCINSEGHFELDAIWNWLDQEPTLSVGIITGTGRAFCAGADLKGMVSRSSSSPLPTKGATQNGTRAPRRVSSANSLTLVSAAYHDEVVESPS